MSKTTALEKVSKLIRDYGFWEAAKSHILKTYSEADKAALITAGTELMINRFRNTRTTTSGC